MRFLDWIFGPLETFHDLLDPWSRPLPLALRKDAPVSQAPELCRCGSFAAVCRCRPPQEGHIEAPSLLTGRGGARLVRRRRRTPLPAPAVADISARRRAKR